MTERISYSNTGGLTWVLFDTNYITKGVFTDYSSLDIRLLPPGEYWIRVDASGPDAPNDREEILAPVTVGTSGRSYCLWSLNIIYKCYPIVLYLSTYYKNKMKKKYDVSLRKEERIALERIVKSGENKAYLIAHAHILL